MSNAERNEVKSLENYQPGSDLRTQLIKVSLDFTDDIRDIIQRILMMRKDLKKAKAMSEGYNGQSIFASA